MDDYTLDRDSAMRLGKVVRRVERMGDKLNDARGLTGFSPPRVGLVRWTGDPFTTETINGVVHALYPGIQVAWNIPQAPPNYPPLNTGGTAQPPGFTKIAPPAGVQQYTNAGQPGQPTNDCWIRVNPDIPFLKQNANKNQWYLGVSSNARQADGLPIFAIDQVWPVDLAGGGALTSGAPITWVPPPPTCPHTLYTFSVPAGSPATGGGATIGGISFQSGYQAGRILTIVNHDGGDLWITGQVATGGINTTIYIPEKFIPNNGTTPTIILKQSDSATFWTDGLTGWYLQSTTYIPLLTWQAELTIPSFSMTSINTAKDSGQSIALPYVGYYLLTAQLNGSITESPGIGSTEAQISAQLWAGAIGSYIGSAGIFSSTIYYSPGGGVLEPSISGTGTLSVIYHNTTPNTLIGLTAQYSVAGTGSSANVNGQVDAVFLSPGALPSAMPSGFTGTL